MVGACDDAGGEVEDGAWVLLVDAGDGLDTEELDGDGFGGGGRGDGDAGPGGEGVDVAADEVGALGEIDVVVGAAELGGDGDEGFVLGARRERARGVLGENGINERGAVFGEEVVEFAGGHERLDGARGCAEDKPGVHALGERDDGVAGLGVSGEDRGVDWGGATPAREEGGVVVDGEAAVEEGSGELLAERDDDPGVGLVAANLGDDGGVVDFGGLEDWGRGEIGGGPLADGGGGEGAAATGGLVGLGDDGGEVVARGEVLEGGEAEASGAEEDETHGGEDRGERVSGFVFGVSGGEDGGDSCAVVESGSRRSDCSARSWARVEWRMTWAAALRATSSRRTRVAGGDVGVIAIFALQGDAAAVKCADGDDGALVGEGAGAVSGEAADAGDLGRDVGAVGPLGDGEDGEVVLLGEVNDGKLGVEERVEELFFEVRAGERAGAGFGGCSPRSRRWATASSRGGRGVCGVQSRPRLRCSVRAARLM